MVEIRELKLSLRAFMRAFRWRKIDPVPCTTSRVPVDECRVALLTSAGLVVPGDRPFDHKVRGGDFSWRVIPGDAAVESLEEHHRSDAFDHAGLEADRNVGLPLDRLHELAAAGEIGGVAPRHVSLMGSITAPGRLLKRTIPEVAEALVDDGVDVALLVPVWPVCHQTVGLVQAELERRGIVTCSITMLPEITRKIRPPRALEVSWPLGFPLGKANDPETQLGVVRAMLGLLDRTDVPVLEPFQPPPTRR